MSNIEVIEKIVLMALNGAGVSEQEADLQIRVIRPMLEDALALSRKELVEKASKLPVLDFQGDYWQKNPPKDAVHLSDVITLIEGEK